MPVETTVCGVFHHHIRQPTHSSPHAPSSHQTSVAAETCLVEWCAGDCAALPPGVELGVLSAARAALHG